MPELEPADADADGGGWCVGRLYCRECGYRGINVYPVELGDGNRECPGCREWTAIVWAICLTEEGKRQVERVAEKIGRG